MAAKSCVVPNTRDGLNAEAGLTNGAEAFAINDERTPPPISVIGACGQRSVAAPPLGMWYTCVSTAECCMPTAMSLPPPARALSAKSTARAARLLPNCVAPDGAAHSHILTGFETSEISKSSTAPAPKFASGTPTYSKPESTSTTRPKAHEESDPASSVVSVTSAVCIHVRCPATRPHSSTMPPPLQLSLRPRARLPVAACDVSSTERHEMHAPGQVGWLVRL